MGINKCEKIGHGFLEPRLSHDCCIQMQKLHNLWKLLFHFQLCKKQQNYYLRWKRYDLKAFAVFLENLVSGTFICADNESKIKEIG